MRTEREVRPEEGRITGKFLGDAQQEQMCRKATRYLNMMAKHKNAPALGQGAEESRAASGQSTEPLGRPCEARKAFARVL